MNTTDTLTPQSDEAADARAVVNHMTTGCRLDEATYRRIRERAERITEEIRREHGDLNIAVDLVRESRDEP